METFVINLTRRQDRRERMDKRLTDASLLSWSFIEGLDASELGASPDDTLTSMNLHCAWISHTRAMKQICLGNHDYALILEDDAVLTPETDWPETLEAIKNVMVVEDLEYLQIGHISAAYPRGKLTKWLMRLMRTKRERRELVLPTLRNSVELGASRAGAHAYVISRHLAELAPKYNSPTWVGPDGFFDRLASATFAEGSLLMGTLTHSLVEQESREFVGSTIDSDNFT